MYMNGVSFYPPPAMSRTIVGVSGIIDDAINWAGGILNPGKAEVPGGINPGDPSAGGGTIDPATCCKTGETFDFDPSRGAICVQASGGSYVVDPATCQTVTTTEESPAEEPMDTTTMLLYVGVGAVAVYMLGKYAFKWW
jgi:hypothetical protein